MVWYNPEDTYSEVGKGLDLPDTTVLRYGGSFIQLRWEIDQKKLMDGEEPARLVVYVSMAQENTYHALIELEADRVEEALKRPPTSMVGTIQAYAEGLAPWCLLDTHHRHMESRWHGFEPNGDDCDSIEKLVIRARQRYTEVGSRIAHCFLRQLREAPPGKNVVRQREVFEKYLRPLLDNGKIAYVWVDTLRFEMGRELARLLKEDFEVEVVAAVAAVPTITQIGMAALLPGADTDATVVAAGSGKVALEINGTVIKDRKDRIVFLKEHAGVEVFAVTLDDLVPQPSKKVRERMAKAPLILVTSQEIDELCETGNTTQARRQMDDVLNDIRRGLRVLLNLGIKHIVLTADHGFLLGEKVKVRYRSDLDRLHFYIPGWEIPKMRVEYFTDHYGFVVDYLAEALRELRKHNFTEAIDRHFSLGSHLNARDVKAVRKTVSGLIKLIYPHGEMSRQELAEITELAIEGRRRVKEQLKKLGSFEYHRTSFSYTDNETREERFVGVPEQGWLVPA